MKPTDWLRRRPDGFWVTVVILGALVAGAVLAIVAIQRPGFRDWLIADESGSSTIRNVGLLVGAIIAMVLAVWRSRVAGRQAATAERGLLNERYQKGAEMLGSDVPSVRMAGIYALQGLAGEHPEQYRVQIMRQFCAFARHPTEAKGAQKDPNSHVREDVQAVTDAIVAGREHHFRLEFDSTYRPDLRAANLRRASLKYADLTSANLSSADLTLADLTGAVLIFTDFTNSRLASADLSGADLTGTVLSGTEFSFHGECPVVGLTQSQLDNAWPQIDNPPNLDGVVDAETGKQLVWPYDSLQDDADGNR